MYRLLIVDDEPYSIEGLLHGVPFEAIEISEVFTAESATEAKKFLLTKQIDILLSDIEMPNESGLELLKWIADCRIDVIPVILTSHADFEYSRKAMKYGSQDYILKPVMYEEVTECLKKAVQKAALLRRQTEANRNEQLFFKNKIRISDILWREILSGELPLSQELIQELVQFNSLLPAEKKVYHVFLVDYFINPLTIHSESIIKKEVLAFIRREITGKKGWCIEHELFFVGIIYDDTGSRLSLADSLAELKKLNSDKFEFRFNAFYTLGAEISEIVPAYLFLQKKARAYSIKKGCILSDAEEKNPDAVPLRSPNTEKWIRMLKTEPENQIIETILDYADRNVTKAQSEGASLESCIEDCLRAIYVAADDMKVDTRILLCPEFQNDLRNATKNFDSFSALIKQIICEFCESRDRGIRSKNLPTIPKTKEFIRANLSKPLQNEQIAQAMFLNADYLNRIFKKETGKTLSEYITDCRIEEAKVQLRTTNKAVSEIALDVGFQTFSYFSKVFKKRVGVEPTKYRRAAAPSNFFNRGE